jgi:hypothetical protein
MRSPSLRNSNGESLALLTSYGVVTTLSVVSALLLLCSTTLHHVHASIPGVPLDPDSCGNFYGTTFSLQIHHSPHSLFTHSLPSFVLLPVLLWL